RVFGVVAVAPLQIRTDGVPAASPLLVLLPFAERRAVPPLAVERVEEARREVTGGHPAVGQEGLHGTLLVPRDRRPLGQAVARPLRLARGRREQPPPMGAYAMELGQPVFAEAVAGQAGEELVPALQQAGALGCHRH